MVAQPTLELTPRQRIALMGVIALVAAEVSLITALRPAGQDGWILAAAVVFDIALFGGGVLMLLAHRRGGWTTLGIQWRSVLQGVLVALALTGLAARVLEVPLGGWLIAPLIVAEAIVGVAVFRAMFRAWRGAEATTPWTRIEAALSTRLPPMLVRAIVGELRILGAAAAGVTRRPIPATPANAYPGAATSAWRWVVVALVMVTVAETALVHLLLAWWLGEGHGAVHALVFGLHAYGVVWLIGDGRLMRTSAHRITCDHLEVDLGLRWSGTIPWSTVRAIRVGEVEEPDRLIGEKRPAHVLAVTPMETPNITLELAGSTALTTYFGITREGSELLLYVDDPAAFADACRQAADLI